MPEDTLQISHKVLEIDRPDVPESSITINITLSDDPEVSDQIRIVKILRKGGSEREDALVNGLHRAVYGIVTEVCG